MTFTVTTPLSPYIHSLLHSSTDTQALSIGAPAGERRPTLELRQDKLQVLELIGTKNHTSCVFTAPSSPGPDPDWALPGKKICCDPDSSLTHNDVNPGLINLPVQTNPDRSKM